MYLLFAYEEGHQSGGGWHDMIGVFTTKPSLPQIVQSVRQKLHRAQYVDYQVVDINTLQVIDDGAITCPQGVEP